MTARRAFGCLLGLLVAAALVAGAAWWWLQDRIATPYRGWAGEERVVVVEPGTPSAHILERLQAEGVIRDATLARLWLVHGRGNPPLRAGEYRFAEPATLDAVLDKLVEGDVLTHPVTVVEGLTLAETAAALADAGMGERGAFLEAMGDPSPVADLDPEAESLEGYLFPSTYHFTRGTTEAQIVAKMAGTFRDHWRREVAPARTPRSPDTARGLVTLASLVEKEAGVDRERPTIAGVYANRLERGIGLYADPTVIFALKRLGEWDGNLTRRDLELDHPYNTYVHPGLPPGPIASPGLASLLAAAAPAEVPYLYFVSRNDGTHVFAETLREHNRNVARWQRRYWRQRWAEERRRAGEEPSPVDGSAEEGGEGSDEPGGQAPR